METQSTYNLVENYKNGFHFDYKGQQLSNNLDFINWKNEMLKEYGRNAKFFKCNRDNLYFCISNEDSKGNKFHLGKCPECQKYICYFCSREGIFNDSADCCVSRKLLCILFHQELDPDINCKENVSDFIPIVSFMYIIGIFSRGFYYRLCISERLYEKKKKEDGLNQLIHYESNISKEMFIPIVAMNVILAFFLSLPYFMLNVEYIIIFSLSNLIFNLRPLRYLSSMIRLDI